MKKIFFVLLPLLFISCNSIRFNNIDEEAGYNEPKEENPLDKFYSTTDDFTGNKFTHFNNPVSYPFTIYLGENGDRKWLRITFSYIGRDWIFFKSATLKNANGDLYNVTISYFEKETNVRYGGVSEHLDQHLSPEEADKLEDFLSVGGVVLRLAGDHYYKDSKISDEAVEAYCELIQISH